MRRNEIVLRKLRRTQNFLHDVDAGDRSIQSDVATGAESQLPDNGLSARNPATSAVKHCTNNWTEYIPSMDYLADDRLAGTMAARLRRDLGRPNLVRNSR